MKKIFTLTGIIILLFSLTLQSQTEDARIKKIAKNWKVTSITDSSGKQNILVHHQDHLSLIGELRSFEHELQAENILLTGDWKLEGDNLILSSDLQPKAESIDSIAYHVVENTPIVIFYKDGEEMTRLTEDRLLSKRDTDVFKIIKVSKDTLVLEGNGHRYTYVGEEPDISSIVQRTGGAFSLITVLRGILGIFVLVFITWLFSSNRRAVSWKVVATGLSIQIAIALGILYIPFVEKFFELAGGIFVVILDFTKIGSTFLFNDLMMVERVGYIFALQILPTIIFFSALTSVLFYLGVIQKVVWVLAWLMTKALKISGAESLSVAGNIFLGQTESPLMIKAYLPKMTDSEMLLVMIGGMATVAGGVLAAYISFLGGEDPLQRLIFAKHLLTASVMAAPGAIVISKILMPQTGKIDMKVEVKQEKIGRNFLDALSNGTTEGLKLAANVGAMLLVFFALIAMFNYILLKIGVWTNLNQTVADITNGQYNEISLQFILGYTFAPLMWAIGVNTHDITLVGQLLGEKLIASEFVGYTSLATLKEAGAFFEQKSVIMSTYMLCGFANFASIGIQIGGIGGLAPNKRWFLSKYGFKALLGGTIASLLSATIIGAIIG
nr:Na+ dependent nucleoside transporter [Bacteroidota bacterium]